MGQKTSKPAAASESAPSGPAAVAPQPPPTISVSQPVIKDVPLPIKQGQPATRPQAVIPPKPTQPIPTSGVPPTQPLVTKTVTQQVASVPVIAKGKPIETVAEKQILSKPTVHQTTPVQKQPVQQRPVVSQQKQPATTPQQKPVSAQQSAPPRPPVPPKASAQSAQASSSNQSQPSKPSQNQPVKQQQQPKPAQQQKQPQSQKGLQQPKPQQQPKPTNQQKPPHTQQKPGPSGSQPPKQKAKKQKQSKQPQLPPASPNAKLPPKPRPTAGKADGPVAGGSLRARMSSPPKLLNTGVAVNQGGVPASVVKVPSVGQTGSASSVVSKVGEKRSRENIDESEATRPVNPVALPSPQRQRKIVRREGDTDTASAKGIEAKAVSPIRGSVDEEKEEGEISDEEMDIPPASRTSLLERISDVYVADPVTSTSYATSSTAGGSGSHAARMDPALMARIDTRGLATSSNSYSQPARTPFPPPSSKQTLRNGMPAQSAPTIPFPKPMPELASQHVPMADIADVSMRDVAQPRTKGVIGRSGNQTTVNGVTILTGKGQGENQLDEAGQRELIEIIVELHNKGISTAELTQRGVPAQLINRVMNALAEPAPMHDSRFTASSTASTATRPARVGPAQSSASTQAGAEHDGDVDMDIDSENDRSPEVPFNLPHVMGQGMGHPSSMFYPAVPMMPMMMPPFPPFPPPFIPSNPAPPAQPAPEIPAPPPPPPANISALPPPPPAEPKLSLSELKAKLLANRKLKQKFSAGLETPEASDTPTTPDFAASTPVPARSIVSQEPQTVSLSTSPVIAHNIAQTSTSSRADSPSIAPVSIGSSAPPESAPFSTVPVNSRRPGAADFVDVPPSRLASSTFFRGNVRRTFAPPHPKRLVVDLDDSSDEGSDSDGEHNSDSKMRSTSDDAEGNEADALRLMHEAEMRIALERKMASVAENRAKLAAFAARKKAEAAKKAATDTPSPVMLSTGVNLAPPTMSEAPSVSPSLSRSTIPSSEVSNASTGTTLSAPQDTVIRDKGKQKAIQTPQQRDIASDKTAKPTSAIIDLTDDEEPAPAVNASASAHFKPYHFFSPHPLTSIPSNSNSTTDTDILDLDQLKNISLSRMMAEHRDRTGKAEEDPVVCKYELRGGSCNDPNCPDFHMRKDIVASQQDLLRFIDMVIPAKKTTPPTIAAAREHLQQLVRSKPDIPPRVQDAEPSALLADGTSNPVAREKAEKIKLIQQRKAALLHQSRKRVVEQFLEEFRKTLRALAANSAL